MELSLLKILILLLLCSFQVFGSETERKKCKLKKLHRHAGFGAGGRKLHYRNNHIYVYTYTFNGTTAIDGGPTEQSGLHLSCQATVKFLSPCEAVLHMSNVDMWDSHQGKQGESHVFTKLGRNNGSLGESLEAVPLRFSYADGVIEEIYPDPADSASALNIKRGLLSAFQNTMPRLDLEHKGEESDIHGRCKVEYRLGMATSSNLTIVKTKDLNSCGDKFGFSSSVKGVPYNFATRHQSMPAVSSTTVCEQVVDRNLIAEVRCREIHRLKSLSRGTAGALTTLVQMLRLHIVYTPTANDTDDELPAMQDLEREDGTDNMSFRIMSQDSMVPDTAAVISRKALEISTSKPASLLFYYEYSSFSTTGPTSNDFQTAKKALTQFCASLKNGVELRSGKLFESLLNILRDLSYPHMMNLAQEAAQICHGDRSHFDGILQAVGTAVSISVIKEKILKRDAPSETINSWISSFTYLAKPDLGLLQSGFDLLRGSVRKEYPMVLLTFSNLAHTYCTDHPKCSNQHPISTLIRLYERYFNATQCEVTKDNDEEQILIYLKGLGNFGLSSHDLDKALGQCIMQQKRTEIRVAAIEAYRRMHCGYNMSALAHVLEDEDEDSEVRIGAFLGLMRCPTYNTIRLIRRLLEREQVNQVGSFLWTYLKNLQETALPSRAELQGLVADEKLKRKFASDVRKYSNNFEISTFYDDLNFGAGLESNIIYSQDSYIPRSASLNLTVDLFGESINVLEATVRIENMEHYLESIWEVDGKLSSAADVYNSLVSSSLPSRKKRAALSKRKLKTLTVEYDAHRRYYSDPVASLSLKTFGNEILYRRKVGTEEQLGWLKSLNPLEHLERLGDKDTNWEKSTMLLDSSYIIPTGAGLPLNLSAQAWSILSVEARNMIDAGNFRANSELKLKGKLQPSALLTVTGSMALGLSRLQTGIKIRANIRSSAAFEGEIHLKGSQLVHVEFGIPQTQIDLIDYASELVILKGTDEIAVGDLPDESERSKDCLFRGLFGLELCGSSYFSLSPYGQNDYQSSFAPYFPLNGPAYFRLSLHKANPNLMKTRIFYEWNNDENETRLTTAYEQVTRTGSTDSSEKLLGLNFRTDKKQRDVLVDATWLQTKLDGRGHLREDFSGGQLDISVKNKRTNAEPFHAQFQYETQTNLDGDEVLRPSGTLWVNSEVVLQSQSELVVTKSAGGVAFDGQGTLTWKSRRHKLETRGSKNSTSVSIVVNSEYGITSGNTGVIRFSSTVTNPKTQTAGQSAVSIALEMSEYPDYNLGASWKHQTSDGRSETETDIRLGRGPAWSDRTALKIRQASVYQKSHEGNVLKWNFYISKPSHHIDYGFDVNLNTRGKSLDSSINLRYAPERNLQTSLSLKRAPGVLTFVQIGWNITLPNQAPLHFTLHLEEKTHRVYEALISTDWFGRNNITLALAYSDKSKKNLLNTTVQFAVQTESTNALKFSARFFHQEDKELKIVLGMGYGTDVTSIEIGHTQWMKGKRHRAYASFQQGPHVHLVSADVETDTGLQCVIKTDFDSKLPDIYVNISSSGANGVHLFSLDYKWDAKGDHVKQFLLETLVDVAPGYFQRTELVVMVPGHHVLVGADRMVDEDGSHIVNARLKWNGENHFHLRVSVTPESDEPEAYKIGVLLDSPIEGFETASIHARYSQRAEMNHDISFEAEWGIKEKIEGSAVVSYEDIQLEDDDDEDDKDVQDDEENALIETKKSRGPFIWSLRANMNGSLEQWRHVRLDIHHRQISPLNVKTDIDIQLPEQKEISIGSEWILPRRLKDILSSRLGLSIKTPFVGYQTTTVQAILGQQEDSDVLGVIGLYTEALHYSITITGTPRLEEDGSLGFEIATSNPHYDKIFARFSYSLGESFRLASQLGWPPEVVISLESALEWNGWEDFQASASFSSPWMPLRNINGLVKIDTSQIAEIKMEFNDKGINGKCEWMYESWMTAELRLDVTTPFETLGQVGLILKNALEDDEVAYSQALAWVNNKKLGFEFKGEKSDVEEEDVLAIIMNGQLELELLVYPTVRSTMSLEQRENKFKLGLSLLLPDGPINVSANLDLIDVFVFNEKIVITTPFSSLMELEINLNPAFIPDSELYNFGVTSRWRSGSDWKEGGLVLRYGDQIVLVETMQQDDFDFPDDEDVEEDEPKLSATQVTKIPTSQFFHFYSPLYWVEEIKMEFERSDDTDQGDQIPFKTLVMAYSGFRSELRAMMTNEQLRQNLYARVKLPNLPEPISVELDGSLDLSGHESRLSVVATSYEGQRQEASLTSSWEYRSNFLDARGEIRTPFDNFEVQYVQVMYARSVPDEKSSVTVELGSSWFGKAGQEEDEGLGKVDATLLMSPGHFSVQLESPFENLRTLEIRKDSEPDENAANVLKTLFVITINDREIQVDVESSMDQNQWPSSVSGTLSSSLKGQTGAIVEALVQKEGDEIKGTGSVDWGDKGKLAASLLIQLPRNRFQLLELKVDAPFDGYEHWELEVRTSQYFEVTDEGTRLLNVEIKGLTPLGNFETTQAEVFLQMGSSFLDVKKATVSGKTPSGSVDIETSWLVEKWNSFDIQCNASYYVLLPSTALPEKNFLKFKLRNEIPTLGSLSLVDSHFFFQTAHLRLGGSTLIEYEEDSSLTVKLISYLPQTSPWLQFKGEFDGKFEDIQATLEGSTDGNDRNYKSTLQLTRGKDSLDGTTEVEWGEEPESRLQSRFNCSFSEEQVVVHLETFTWEIKSLPSDSRAGGGGEDERQVNFLVDGTFNKISGLHKARIEGGRAREPVILDVHLGYQGLSEIDSSFNLTTIRPFYNITTAGLSLSNKIQGNKYEGALGGHWGPQEGLVDYKAEYETHENDEDEEQDGMIKFAGTVHTKLPFTRARSAAMNVAYEMDGSSRAGLLQADFNDTRLFGLKYNETSSTSPPKTHETRVEIDNHIWPIGLAKLWKHYAAQGPAVVHGVELYDLKKPVENKLTGEVSIITIDDGQKIILKGIHPSRTVEVETINRWPSDSEFKHDTKLTWNTESSLGWALELSNTSTGRTSSYTTKMKVHHPVREVTLSTEYRMSGHQIQIKTTLNPNTLKSSRALEGKLVLDATGDFGTQHTTSMDLTLKHPALKHDIRSRGELRVQDARKVDGDLWVDYSGDASRKVTLSLRTPPVSLTKGGEWNVTTDVRLEHPVTNLDLQAHHANQHSSRQLSIITLLELKGKGGNVGQKSKIAFELFKKLRKLLIMLKTPQDELNVLGILKGQHPDYVLDGIVTGNGNVTLAQTTLDLATERPYYNFHALYGQGLKDGLLSKGGVEDSRNIKFDITELTNEVRNPHVNFYLRLNHSRLITSKLQWRPDMDEYLEEWYAEKSKGVRNAWSQQSDKLLLALSTQVSQVTEQIWEDAKTAIGPFIQEMRDQTSVEEEVAEWEAFVNRTWENNDFYIENVTAFVNLMREEISLRFSNVFLRLRDYRKELLGDSSQLFEKTVLWILEKLRESYRQLVTAWHAYRRDSPSLSLSLQPIRDKFSALFDQIAESLVSWADYWSDIVTRYGSKLIAFTDGLIQQYKPAMMELFHKIEDFGYKIFRIFSDFISEKQAEVMNSSYYRQAVSLADDADRIYKELVQNDTPTNIRKFYQKLIDYVVRKYENGSLGQIVQEIQSFFTNLWEKLDLTERIENFKQTWNTLVAKVQWMSEYLHVDETVQEVLVTLYTKGGELVYQTILEARARYQKAKTKFIFDPRRGLIELEQRLPMPWAAFNETPAFTELPEYKNVQKLQELFQSSNGPFWGAIGRIKKSGYKEASWLPPDDGRAMLVGSEYLFTFDGKAYNLTGRNCLLLLAADMVDGNFSVSIDSSTADPDIKYYIHVTSQHNTILIGFDNNYVVKVIKRGKIEPVAALPIQLQHLRAYQDGRSLVVESRRGMSVSCNLAYRICELRVSGWYSRKAAGLLGTMDNEPTTDMLHSNRRPLDASFGDMVKSWDVSGDSGSCVISQPAESLKNKRKDPKTAHTCHKFFKYILSSLQPCFSTVSVGSYVEMCEGAAADAICTAAMSYVSMCRTKGVSISPPSQCIKCDMNGEEMMDRDVREMDAAESSGGKSSDIVFIVEAKDCNKNVRDGSRMGSLARILEEEMAKANFVSNRYALVVFGGNGVFEKPHQILVSNEGFTGANEIGRYFHYMSLGNGSGDVFGAVAFTLNNLRFRPGVSKTFILLPCSSCQPQHLTMDFSAIRYALLEQDATLHILMNNDFTLDNKSHGKKFLGMDSNLGYMRVNSTRLRGETKIRQQVKVPRRVLGYCTQLALQTNGSIFTAKKLQNRKAENVKLFSTVFSQRIVQTARPAECQTCYCSPDQDGVGRIQCFLCDYSRYKALPPIDSSSSESMEEKEKEEDRPSSPGSEEEAERGRGRDEDEENDDGSEEED